MKSAFASPEGDARRGAGGAENHGGKRNPQVGNIKHLGFFRFCRRTKPRKRPSGLKQKNSTKSNIKRKTNRRNKPKLGKGGNKNGT